MFIKASGVRLSQNVITVSKLAHRKSTSRESTPDSGCDHGFLVSKERIGHAEGIKTDSFPVNSICNRYETSTPLE